MLQPKVGVMLLASESVCGLQDLLNTQRHWSGLMPPCFVAMIMANEQMGRMPSCSGDPTPLSVHAFCHHGSADVAMSPGSAFDGLYEAE